MSTVPTPHKAKDGLYYPSYEEVREANIRRNHAVLVEKGLAKPILFQSMGAVSPPKRRAPPPQVVTPTEPRRVSRRLRNAPDLLLESMDDWSIQSKPKRKRSDSTGDEHDDRTKRRRRQQTSVEPLSEEERLTLSGIKSTSWLDQMEDYLTRQENLTRPNYMNVMKQVKKMVFREGITYSGWEEGTVFGQEGISLSDDFVAMYDHALDFEDKHGRDKGNGWLLRHPIKKLTNFQHYFYLHRKENDTA